ncbi:MAG: hypothetical protein J0I80_14850 [Sphingomonas sp.]|nr:hypothetical protein [Sphingomonas sp.]
MRIAVHQLIIAGAVALGGTLGGIVAGNYTTGAPRLSGAPELAYGSFSADGPVALAAMPDQDGADLNGPTSYECQGCDAHLYPDPPALYADASYDGQAKADVEYQTSSYETSSYEGARYDPPSGQSQEAPVVVSPAAAPVVGGPVAQETSARQDFTMVSAQLPDGVVRVGRPGIVTSNRPADLQ